MMDIIISNIVMYGRVVITELMYSGWILGEIRETQMEMDLCMPIKICHSENKFPLKKHKLGLIYGVSISLEPTTFILTLATVSVGQKRS